MYFPQISLMSQMTSGSINFKKLFQMIGAAFLLANVKVLSFKAIQIF